MAEEKANRATLTSTQAQWRNLFVESLYKVCHNVHPGIGLEKAAVDHVEELLVLLLFELLECRPGVKSDLERRIQTVFPAPLNIWACKEADETVELYGGKKLHRTAVNNGPPFLPLVQKVQTMLRDYLGYKLDEKLTLYIVSVLQHIASDILKLTGNYVKNIRNKTITLQDLKIALGADRVLMDLMEILYDDGEQTNYDIFATENSDENKQNSQELTYDQASRDLIHEESQYLRELSILLHVFRRSFQLALGNYLKKDSPFISSWPSVFGNLEELHTLTVRLLRSLEDALEMSDSPCVGAVFWELAEGQEFDVYIQYIQEVFDPRTPSVDSLLGNTVDEHVFQFRGQGSPSNCFVLAVKYVLPTLLQTPLVHCYRYFDYLSNLRRLAENQADKDDLDSSHSYFDSLKAKLDACCSSQLRRSIIESQSQRVPVEARKTYQLKQIREIQQTIGGWTGKDIGFSCSKLIKEGCLMQVRFRMTGHTASDTLRRGRSPTLIERRVFLFDHLIVICKVQKCSNDYKLKEKMPIRKSDIIDLEDSEELKNAFEIRCSIKTEPIVVSLLCKTADDKRSWMSALVILQTRSMLDRMLDVYLKEEEKRIPLIIPTPEQYRFSESDTDENIVFEDYTSSSGIPIVKNGTVVKLIERLTYHLYTDNVYVATFLTTYRSFCTPSELLTLLLERFRIPIPTVLLPPLSSSSPPQKSPKFGWSDGDFFDRDVGNCVERSFQRFRKEYMRPVQLRVLSVFRQWVIRHWYDFERDADLLQTLEHFLGQEHTRLHKKWIRAIQTGIERQRQKSGQQSGDETIRPVLNEKPPPILWHLATPGDPSTYDMLSLHPLEIGRQVTLLESDLYRAVKPIELVGAAWTKQDKNVRSPQLLKITQHSTMLTYWIACSIVRTSSLDERVALFSRVLEVMCTFEELNNFTGLVAFYSALNSSSVFRLAACWEVNGQAFPFDLMLNVFEHLSTVDLIQPLFVQRLDKEKQSAYARFKKLCNPHWTEMIERLRTINPPCVPFFGHYLSRIFFFEEGNSTFITHIDPDLKQDPGNYCGSNKHQPLVSFTKCRKIADIIRDIQMYQNQPYTLQVEPSIRAAHIQLYNTGHIFDFRCALLAGNTRLFVRVGGLHMQFFETLNPLNDFDSKEALETYLFEQSHKVEPKDPEKWEIVKSSRSAQMLKSPGIKPPKTHHQRMGKGTFSNNYQQEMDRPPGSSSDDNPFAIVDINPGHPPRYIRDVTTVFGGASPPSTPLTLPPLHRATSSSCATSPSSSASPRSPPAVPPRPPRAHRPTSPRSTTDRITNSPVVVVGNCMVAGTKIGIEPMRSFVFPPPVPPRTPASDDRLPYPLPVESLVPPPLLPRISLSTNVEPPPRPPKKTSVRDHTNVHRSCSSEPPPLPPKTYKQRKRPVK